MFTIPRPVNVRLLWKHCRHDVFAARMMGGRLILILVYFLFLKTISTCHTCDTHTRARLFRDVQPCDAIPPHPICFCHRKIAWTPGYISTEHLIGGTFRRAELTSNIEYFPGRVKSSPSSDYTPLAVLCIHFPLKIHYSCGVPQTRIGMKILV